jgi:hypothetical protein
MPLSNESIRIILPIHKERWLGLKAHPRFKGKVLSNNFRKGTGQKGDRNPKGAGPLAGPAFHASSPQVHGPPQMENQIVLKGWSRMGKKRPLELHKTLSTVTHGTGVATGVAANTAGKFQREELPTLLRRKLPESEKTICTTCKGLSGSLPHQYIEERRTRISAPSAGPVEEFQEGDRLSPHDEFLSPKLDVPLTEFPKSGRESLPVEHSQTGNSDDEELLPLNLPLFQEDCDRPRIATLGHNRHSPRRFWKSDEISGKIHATKGVENEVLEFRRSAKKKGLS